MRRFVIPVVLAACSSSDDPRGNLPDAAVAPDAAPDAVPDAPCETVLFRGGTDPGAQGWTIIQNQPSTLTNGVDDIEIKTTTTTGANTGGQLLLARPGSVDPAQPFAIEVVMRIDSVGKHNQADAGAAILGSLTGMFGQPDERSQMFYVDPAAIGWADNAQSVAAALVDSAFHTYVLAVDAAHTATLAVDGVVKLTRANYATNGTIAVGDQTNDPNLDATMRVRTITKLCATP